MGSIAVLEDAYQLVRRAIKAALARVSLYPYDDILHFAENGAGGFEVEGNLIRAKFDGDALDDLFVAAIKGVSQAEHGGKALDNAAVPVGEGAELGVVEFGPGLAMVAGDLRDEFDLGGGEGFPRTFADETGRFFVVAVAKVVVLMADVVQVARSFEEEALAFTESVQGRKAVEELEGQAADVLDVKGAVLELAHEGGNLFARDDGGVRHGFDSTARLGGGSLGVGQGDEFKFALEEAVGEVGLLLGGGNLARGGTFSD